VAFTAMNSAMLLRSLVPGRRIPGAVAPWMGRVVGCLALACLIVTRADGPDDRFIDVYNLIQLADQSPDRRAARQMYEDAQGKLRQMQRDFPAWNERVISYRLRYTADKLSTLAKTPDEPAPAVAAGTPPPAKIAGDGEVMTQFNDLTQQIRLLQTDKQLLEAKLREALSAQPAPVDPREFQAAIERIAALQQTNKSLLANLTQQQAERANLVDRVVAEETQKALAEANRALAGQREKADQMERERTAAAAELKRLREESVNPLKLENAILKQQVTGLKSGTDKGRQVADLTAQLTRLETGLQEMKEQNATLLADKNSLEKQLEDLRAKSAEEGIVKIAQLESQLAVAKSDSARQSAQVEDIIARLAQEKQERTELQSENRNLAKRVADLTANSTGDAQVMKELQDSLAAEKSERAQVEAELKSFEERLAALQSAPPAARPTGIPAADAVAEAAGASLLRELQLKGLQAEVVKLRDAVKSSTQRETELASALTMERSLRQRLEKEKGDLEQRLAAANVELAANRVEKSRTAASGNGAGAGAGAPVQTAAALELRVKGLEEERETLRTQLAGLIQRTPLALAANRARRAVSPRERAVDFLQYRQLKAFAPEPLIGSGSGTTLQGFQK